MRRFFTRRPSPAMVMGFIAMVAALSGTAVALPGVNLIDSGDIKNGQVKRKDIGKNAVTGAKVANGSLTGADVKDKSLTPSDFSGSVQGPQGPQGIQGEKGDTGAPGISGYEVVQVATATNSNSFKSNSLSCPGGKSIIGGGSNVSGSIAGIAILQDGPDSGVITWESSAQEIVAQAGGWSLTTTIYCANVAPS
jgi:hypothetical protein